MTDNYDNINYNDNTNNFTGAAKYRQNIQQKFGIIGDSEPIQRAIDTLMVVAPTDLPVLITGETGTGKEVFANAVHSLSERKNKPFVSVNCGAIPETLLESELFGHERGAFTSANEQRIGFFEAANNGTIFLDEIGEMPVGTQVKLLRILESGEFSRLGSSVVNKVNVRLIAATNRNLEKEVRERNFRQDLYYRLNSVNIALPSLREHIQDTPLYFEFFAKKICQKNGIKYNGISDNAVSLLKSLLWQGNIREFKNLVDKIIILEKGDYVSLATLQKYIPAALPENSDVSLNSTALVPTSHNVEIMSNDTLILRTLLEIKQDITDIKQALGSLGTAFRVLRDDVNYIKDTMLVYYDDAKNNDNDEIVTINDMDKKMIQNALNKCMNNKRKAASLLGISERTLYRKIKLYKLE